MLLTYERYTELLHYIRWSEADADALRALRPHVVPRAREISDEFYERVREHPEARDVFKDEAQVLRLQETLQRWVLELLDAQFDEAYFALRFRIGAVHARVGVAQRYVSAAMTLVRLALVRIADTAFADDPDRGKAVRIALDKAIDVELAIMLDTYRSALTERLARAERLEREGVAVRLAAAEQRYVEAIESAEVMWMVLDEDARVVLWNRRAAQLSGFARDEVRGVRVLDSLVKDDDVRDRILSVSVGHPLTFESSLSTRSDKTLHVRWFISATRDPESGSRTLYALAVDLTDIRKTEQRSRQAERLAAIGTMAAGLAHEIRNPLNAASLHLQILSRSLGQLGDATPPAALEAAQVLKDEVHRLSGLVTEFLELARTRRLDLGTHDLRELVRGVLELLHPDLDTSGWHVDLVTSTRPVWAHCDAERIRQVLLNLLRNAMDAAPTGGHVTVRARKVGTAAEIDVQDDGGGIPEGAPVFDAFYTTKESGTGLGLAIAHRILVDHDGSLTFRSRPGETIFTMSLPSADPPTS